MKHFDQINRVGVTKDQAFQVALDAEKSRDFSPTIQGVTVGLSSGTSGNKGIFLANARERAIWVASVLDRIIGFSWKHRKVAFFLRANSNLYESVGSRLLTFSFFDIITPIATHKARFLAYDPEILVAQPSVLLDLARELKDDSVQLSLSKVISVAEVLYPEDKAYLEKVFGVRVDQVYQCTEGFLAHTCSKGNLHFNSDWLLIEKKYIDEEKVRYHPVITDFLRRSQPVVRYELNDIIHEGPPCDCGLASETIAKIEGRSDDVFRFPRKDKTWVTIYPDFIRRSVIGASDRVTEYKVTQTSADTVSYYLDMPDEADDGQEAKKVEKALRDLLIRYNLDDVQITRTYDNPHVPGTKKLRIHNAYRPTV